ncbi:hypothetical protein Slin14017_G121800 [Septoria linicola]|nr:hypothetical protein Slin14017_G121800 [Septoria linicola]
MYYHDRETWHVLDIEGNTNVVYEQELFCDLEFRTSFRSLLLSRLTFSGLETTTPNVATLAAALNAELNYTNDRGA